MIDTYCNYCYKKVLDRGLMSPIMTKKCKTKMKLMSRNMSSYAILKQSTYSGNNCKPIDVLSYFIPFTKGVIKNLFESIWVSWQFSPHYWLIKMREKRKASADHVAFFGNLYKFILDSFRILILHQQ